MTIDEFTARRAARVKVLAAMLSAAADEPAAEVHRQIEIITGRYRAKWKI